MSKTFRKIQLVKVPDDEWRSVRTKDAHKRFAVWQSPRFLVQAFRERDGIIRLSVNRTGRQAGRWQEGITWDELQEIKSQCGYGDQDAVEIYPTDHDVVNVANMRHVWVLPERVCFAWRQP